MSCWQRYCLRPEVYSAEPMNAPATTIIKKQLHVGIVAGEVSGDTLGAGLMQAIRRLAPEATFSGIGGPKMIALGFTSIAPMERLSVMGFIEPLGRLPELLRIKKALETRFISAPPDVFIGIDSPGFNIRLEKVLHAAGITTVHYVSPSVWAWGEKRIHDIAKAVDLVLALFPFETQIYQKFQIGVRFVGHPLADQIDPDADDAQQKVTARQALGLSASGIVLALMPGSRRAEIDRLGSIFFQTARNCLQQNPALQFVVPCANAERCQQVQEMLAGLGLSEHFQVFEGHSHIAMQAADLVVLASGTATLEAMLFKRPMIVCYRLAALTYFLASRMLKVPYVSLPNLLANELLVPEYLQDKVTVPALTIEIERMLSDVTRQNAMLEKFVEIHRNIRCDASAQAADAVLQLIRAKSKAGDLQEGQT